MFNTQSAKLKALEASVTEQVTGYTSGQLLSQLKHEQQKQLDQEVDWIVFLFTILFVTSSHTWTYIKQLHNRIYYNDMII